MSSLPELVSKAMELNLSLVETGGELTPELEAALAVSEQALAQKVDSYVVIQEQLKAQEAIWSDKAAHFQMIADGFRKAHARLNENIKVAMKSLNADEMPGEDYRYKLVRGRPSLIIENPEKIPASFKMIVTDTLIDKEEVRQALTKGEVVEGCRLEDSFSLRRFANNKGKK